MGGIFYRGDAAAVASVAVIVVMTAFRLHRLYRPALEERPAFGQRLLLWIALAFLVFGPFIAQGDRFDLGTLFVFYAHAFAILLFERVSLDKGRWVAGPAFIRNLVLLLASVLLAPPFLFERSGYLVDKAQRGLLHGPILAVLWVSTLRFLIIVEVMTWTARRVRFERARAWLALGRRAELLAVWPLLWTGAFFIFGQVGLLIHWDALAWWQGAAAYAWAQAQGFAGAWRLFSGALEPMAKLPWVLWALALSGLIAVQELGKALRLAGLAAAALVLAMLLHGAVAAGVWAQIEAMRPAPDPDPAATGEPSISSVRRWMIEERP